MTVTVLVRENEIRSQVSIAFERLRTKLHLALPYARVEHVGSTAIPGALTKGDLDVCAVVSEKDFAAAKGRLADAFQIHQPENWTDGFASFIAPPEDGVDIGVQLVVAESTEEAWFIAWRELLRSDSDLRNRYDQLKLRHQADPTDSYRAAKERLILNTLRKR